MANSKNPSLIQFGNHLKALRMKKKLSAKRLALLCGIDVDYIRRYEAGELDVNFLLMIKLAKVLELELWMLMDYTDRT